MYDSKSSQAYNRLRSRRSRRMATGASVKNLWSWVRLVAIFGVLSYAIHWRSQQIGYGSVYEAIRDLILGL